MIYITLEPWSCPDTFTYKPILTGLKDHGIEIVFEHSPYLLWDANKNDTEFALNFIDIFLTDENSFEFKNLNLTPDFTFSPTFAKVVVDNYQLGSQYDVNIIYKMKQSTIDCTNMKTRLDTSFTLCSDKGIHDTENLDNEAAEPVKIDELCDGKVDCTNEYDEADEKCKGDNFVVFVIFV